MTNRIFAILLVSLVAASCRDQRPPSPSADQSDQLNETESMLNAMDKAEGPAPNGTGPSNSSD